jgi:hypothetical protein
MPNAARRGAPSRPGHHALVPGQTPEGQHVLAIIVKRTYAITDDGTCRRAELDRKVMAADKHYDDPMNTSVEFAADFIPFKIATDVAVNAVAYVPGGTPARELVASVVIGAARKDVRVIGDRTAIYQPGGVPAFTEPLPFVSMPMRYERAYGGVDIASDPTMPAAYARNHLGRGYIIRNAPEVVDGLELPNIEDPADALTPERLCSEHFMHWERQPRPAGIGWTCRNWRPRAMYAGVMPADRALEAQLFAMFAKVIPSAQRALFEQTRLPPMDFRFFNGASDGLVRPFLSGAEPIRLINLTRDGDVAFTLPGERPTIALDIGDGAQSAEVVLHTVMIHAERREVDLVWRAAFPYRGPDWLPEMKTLEVLVT